MGKHHAPYGDRTRIERAATARDGRHRAGTAQGSSGQQATDTSRQAVPDDFSGGSRTDPNYGHPKGWTSR
jgi:hypothetical protein